MGQTNIPGLQVPTLGCVQNGSKKTVWEWSSRRLSESYLQKEWELFSRRPRFVSYLFQDATFCSLLTFSPVNANL